MPDIQDAISLLEQRESRKAARVLEQIVAEMPAYATARVLLARCYEALDDWDLALSTWQEALQLVPNSPVIRRALRRTAARSGSMPRQEQAEAEARENARPTEGRPQGVPHGTVPPAEGAPPAGVPRSPDAPPVTEPRASDAPTSAKSRAPEPTSGTELRAQDVPPPMHQPPRPREEARPADEAGSPGIADQTRSLGTADEAGSPGIANEAEARRNADISRPPPFVDDAAKPDARGGSGSPDNLPELQDVQDTGTPHYEDLERLISELESARIVPRPDLDSVPTPDLEDDIEDVVSETLARIYASQGQYDEAARVYELLAGQHPKEADDYLRKASNMRSRASDGP